MTACIQAILAIWLALPHCYLDRADSHNQRISLYRPAAAAICRLTKVRWERAWLAAQAWHETRLARHVLEERCKDGPPGMRCHWVDGPLSIGPWQPQRKWCPGALWAFSLGDRYLEGARCALRLARMGRASCGTIEGAFAHQSGDGGCFAEWAQRRVPTFYRAMARVR